MIMTDALDKQRAHAAANPNAVNIIQCLEEMIEGFNDRFGDGTSVFPVNCISGKHSLW